MTSEKPDLQQTTAVNITAMRDAFEKAAQALTSYEEATKQHDNNEDLVAKAKIAAKYQHLTHAATNFQQEVRGPVNSVYEYFEKSSQGAAIHCLLRMGAFEEIPVDGSFTTPELAKKLDVDPKLLNRLLVVASTTGVFLQLQEEKFAHTPFSKAYLNPQLRGMFLLVFNEFVPAWAKLSDYFSAKGWRNPSDMRDSPYTYAHQTGGKVIFEHVANYPERTKALNLGMGAQTETSLLCRGIVDSMAKRLLTSCKTTKDSILVVDVGGGKGHDLQRITKLIPDIEGRLILQDLQEVLDDTYDLDERIEKHQYNFFEPQPVKGAHIYLIRRILHDWPDKECVQILKNVAAAMERTSRVMIAEIIVPPTGADLETGWMDPVMMSVGGAERSKKHWEELLEAAGLKLEGLEILDGTDHGAIQAVLA